MISFLRKGSENNKKKKKKKKKKKATARACRTGPEAKNLFHNFSSAVFKKQDDAPTSDISHKTNARVSISTQCNACEKYFTESTIFKHISHSYSCKAEYSNEEIQAFKDWARQRKELGRMPKKHDSVKRRERYLKEKCSLKRDKNQVKSFKLA